MPRIKRSYISLINYYNINYLNLVIYMIEASIEDLKRELWLRKRESLVWETKDGKKIPIKEMSTSHIINAINYFNSRQEEESIYDDLRGLTMDDIC